MNGFGKLSHRKMLNNLKAYDLGKILVSKDIAFLIDRKKRVVLIWNSHLEYDSKTLESVQRSGTLTKESQHLPYEE